MSLINFYTRIKKSNIHNPQFDIHKLHLPGRFLVVTSSGGGKTNYVLNLLHEMYNTFHRIIVITKAEEPLYTHMQKKLKHGIEIIYTEENMIYPEFSKMNNGENGLIIFDDMVTTKDKRIDEMFIRGRKLGYSCIYISQNYFGTPTLIRRNVNYIALGKGINKRDLRLILSEYSIDLNLDDFTHLYFQYTREKMNFILIDTLENNIRHNIKDIIYPRQI